MLKASSYHIIPAQMHIAQLLLLRYVISKTQNTMGGEGSVGSTDNQSVFWTESIKLNKPILHLKTKDKTFHGLIDMGADISVISNQFWPPKWPLTDSRTPVTGIGGVSQPQDSIWSLRSYRPECQVGRIQPYILPMHLNIWGRDLLSQWGMQISLPPFL